MDSKIYYLIYWYFKVVCLNSILWIFTFMKFQPFGIPPIIPQYFSSPLDFENQQHKQVISNHYPSNNSPTILRNSFRFVLLFQDLVVNLNHGQMKWIWADRMFQSSLQIHCNCELFASLRSGLQCNFFKSNPYIRINAPWTSCTPLTIIGLLVYFEASSTLIPFSSLKPFD